MEEKTKKKLPNARFNNLDEINNLNIDYDPRYGMEPGVELENYKEYLHILEKICRNDGIFIKRQEIDETIKIVNRNTLEEIEEVSDETSNELLKVIQNQKAKIKNIVLEKDKKIQELIKEKEILESKIMKDLVAKIVADLSQYSHSIPVIQAKTLRLPPSINAEKAEAEEFWKIRPSKREIPERPKESAFREVVAELKEVLSSGNALKPIDTEVLKEIKEERRRRMDEIKKEKLF